MTDQPPPPARQPAPGRRSPADLPASGGPPVPPEGGRDRAGQRIGEFQVLRLLGRGGMGEVYLAEQTSLDRHVALKVLKLDAAGNPTYIERFKQEGKAAARLNHPNIVQVYGVGEAAGELYIALEYVQGPNLRDYLAKKGPPPLPLALSIMRQVAAALMRAGEEGLVHRDIKPENILLTRKGVVKVADFGLCRRVTGRPVNLTQTGITMGTPLYMSPEQVEGQNLDVRSDIYSFGITCYHMMAGHPPFQGTSPLAVAVQHVKAQPVHLQEVRPDLPPVFCRVIMKMMAKDPANRYQTAAALYRELGRLKEKLGAAASGEQSDEVAEAVRQVAPVATGPGPTRRSSASLVRLVAPRHGMGWKFVLALVVALAAGAGMGWMLRQPSLLPPPAAPVPPTSLLALADWEAVPRQLTAERQYAYALLVAPTAQREAAWIAVRGRFSDDPVWVPRADVHLVETLFQLRQPDQLEAAAQLFERAANPTLAEIARAAALSLRDQSAESTDRLDPIARRLETSPEDGQLFGRLVRLIVLKNFKNQDSQPSPHWERQLQRIGLPRSS